MFLNKVSNDIWAMEAKLEISPIELDSKHRNSLAVLSKIMRLNNLNFDTKTHIQNLFIVAKAYEAGQLEFISKKALRNILKSSSWETLFTLDEEVFDATVSMKSWIYF
jgi:hypothetical protein